MTRRARIEGHRDPVVRLALMRPRGGGGVGTVTDVTGTSPVVITGSPTATPNVTLVIPDGQILIGGAGSVPAPHAVSGDATLSDTGALTLATVNPDVGTFGDATHVAQVTVDAKGQVTAVASVPISSAGVGTVTDVTGTSPVVITGSPTATPNVTLVIPDGQILIGGAGSVPAPHAVSGDATLSDTGALTLATVNPDVGTFGDSTHVAQVTVDGKGQVTAVVAVAIASSGGTVTDVTGTSPIVSSGGATPAISLTKPAETYAVNTGAPIAITNAFAAIIAANITPEVSGKVTVAVAGVVENADSSNTHFFSWEITTGLGVALAPDAISVPPSFLGIPGRASFSSIVALDQAPTNPVTFAPLGTLANISVAAKADVNSQLQIIAQSIQVESRERFA
jgi:predicted secreted protein